MTRKAVSVVLVLCLVANLMSCYSMKTKRYYEVPAAVTQYEAISVHTKDGKVAVFKSGVVANGRFIGTDEQGRPTEISLDQISYVEISTREISTGKTVLAVVGGSLLAAALAITIIALVASCPQASSFDGETWVLEAEPNAGALTRTTEYTDYNVLKHLRPLPEGEYRIRLETNLEEIDFTDDVKLLAVDHRPGVEVMSDVVGDLVAFSDLRTPDRAVTDTGVDLVKQMDADGRLFWDGDPHKTEFDRNHPRDEIQLTFANPSNARKGVLVFEGSSTFWSTYVMADFLSRFGKSSADRLKRLEGDPGGRDKIESFLERSGYYVEVMVKDGENWKSAGHLRSAGTYVSRVQALQIALPENASGRVDLKLRYAPFFWNIQTLGISYSLSESDLNVTEIAPARAIDRGRGNIKSLLAAHDGDYYRSEKGDAAEIVFGVPPLESGRERTLILKTTGYYNFVLDPEKELPFAAQVWQSVKTQGIDGYSLDLLREVQEQAGYN